MSNDNSLGSSADFLGSNVPPQNKWLYDLHSIISDPSPGGHDPSNCGWPIVWASNGKGFVITDKTKFIQMVLPKFLPETKYESMTRRLNRWGFERCNSGSLKGCYFHPNFQRNQPQLINTIVPNQRGKGQRSNGVTRASVAGVAHDVVGSSTTFASANLPSLSSDAAVYQNIFPGLQLPMSPAARFLQTQPAAKRNKRDHQSLPSITAGAGNVDNNKITPSTEGIRLYSSQDVLFGRGGGTNIHPGNVTFRKMIEAKRNDYLMASKNDKPDISRSIVCAIRQTNGRFLQKDEETQLWFEVGDDSAREKTSQALRQKAPERREALSRGEEYTPEKQGAKTHPNQQDDAPVQQAYPNELQMNNFAMGSAQFMESILPNNMVQQNNGMMLPNNMMPNSMMQQNMFGWPDTLPHQQLYNTVQSDQQDGTSAQGERDGGDGTEEGAIVAV